MNVTRARTAVSSSSVASSAPARSTGLLALSLFALAASSRAARAAADELPGKPPNTSAPAHQPCAWNSKRDLRFVWWLPEKFEPHTQRTMTVILHGRGFDYRWGWKNQPVDVFRTDDVVISVDGTSADGDHRWFSSEKKDADAFQTFLVEVTNTFGVERVLLYGHVEGGTFALYFAGEHPEMIAGVVAHDGAPIAPPKLAPEAPKPVIVFMHGTIDPDDFFAHSLDARAAWSKAGFPLVHLRRLEHASYEPNPRRANEELDWCDAMTTAKPEVALGVAIELASVSKSDPSRMQTATDFGGTREILRRFEGKGPAPFAAVDANNAARAKELTEKIEAAGAQHVLALKKAIPKKKDLKLDGKLPIGHLAAMREDFRGVESVEAYVRDLGYDALFESQQKPANAILDVWRKNKEPKVTFDVALENLSKAWLYEGLPPDFAETLRAWKRDEKKLGLSSRGLKSWPVLDEWQRSWDDGLKEYAEIWKEWKGP